jgi:hypothetical protein
MNTLSNLKQRLQALPKLREGRDQEETYASLLKKTVICKEHVEHASAGAVHAEKALPCADYDEVLKKISRIALSARKLKADLDDAPVRILEGGVEKRFTRMNETASSAWEQCKKVWKREVEAKVRDWLLLCDVICKVFGNEGSMLKSTVISLNNTQIPETEAEAQKVLGHLNALSDAIGKLDLETAFCKFLKAVASPQGASLSDAQKADVKEVITKHNMEHVFRVKLT